MGNPFEAPKPVEQVIQEVDNAEHEKRMKATRRDFVAVTLLAAEMRANRGYIALQDAGDKRRVACEMAYEWADAMEAVR